MRYRAFLFFVLVLGVFVSVKISSFSKNEEGKSLVYPKFRLDPKVDIYHGVEVKDPFRSLEDLDSKETKRWVCEQNNLTFDYLKKIPEREAIYTRLTSLWNYERYGLITKKADRYFFTKNDGLQNQYVLYTFNTLEETPELLLDPNQFSSDGTIALSFYSPSEDGKLLAYGVSSAGSDWVEIKVLDIKSKKELSDNLKWVKFSGATWLLDNSGFYYARYEKPSEGKVYEEVNYNQKIFFHKMGTSQEEDVLVYERPDHKDWIFSPAVTEDGKYFVLSVTQGAASQNAIFYKELHKEEGFKELFSDFDAVYDYIGNEGSFFWFKTDKEAAKGKIVGVELEYPNQEHWVELIAESSDTLLSANVVGNRFVMSYLQDAHSQVKIFSVDGTLEKEVVLPNLGTANGFYGKREDVETFYMFTSFTDPATVYRYDLLQGQSTLIFTPTFPTSLENFVTKQVFYKSLDGTEVPMFLVSKKDIPLDGNNPVYLYGYGGFDVSLTPFFSPAVIAWLEMGGVFALANIRGGGEYGEYWHNSGKLDKKQNGFDDFIAGAEFLIKEKITNPSKLSISGGSNGGLLVGACLIQRPELFGAVIPSVGVLDMLKYHKFTIGWAWIPEYGSSDDATQFSYLYKYSPLHNVKIGEVYPPTLILTADHDDRVVPAHSFKFAATLQEAQNSSAPILIRIETSAGHGSGKPTSKIIEETADKFAFLVKHLDIKMD